MDIVDKRNARWILTLLPYSVAIGPLGTLITLEIASLRGGPVDVGYAMAAGSAAGIIAPLLWGFLLDRYGSRDVLALGFLGTALFILALTYAPNVPQITLYYAASSLFSSAVGVSTSFILVKSSSRLRLNESYSMLNFINSMGYLVGDVSAAVLSGFMDIKAILLIMGLLPIISFAWSLVSVPRVSNGEGPVLSRQLVSGRVRDVGLGELVTLYLALVIFYFSSGIFNTLYPYGLRVGGLSRSWVMTIISVGMGIQIMGFMITPRIIRLFGGNARASSRALILRGLSYFLIGLTSTTPEAMMITGLTLYPLAAGIAFSTFYTASSVMVFERLGSGEEGRGLGAYNFITGSAYLAGSLTSGYLADSIGIGGSYMVAGAMLWVSSYLFEQMHRSEGVRRILNPH
ncbi:MFS transporter [Vulcanisaeta distributa]|uniref:Major facilitator superfamily MFS_1 n=1 Tax=Vulcanisaeta distributa (strain DSM 14429 / JCM 11212 / NBRC 100878 / IC-017) TaxID=572478 RepID=E1QUG7_VULDI|nr:MFS transporter [Vulcanisaeta distributa]ADN49893.1 major facilitator superfamily MFS_1 [Vulcanisaeta distributa DSM 14429]